MYAGTRQNMLGSVLFEMKYDTDNVFDIRPLVHYSWSGGVLDSTSLPNVMFYSHQTPFCLQIIPTQRLRMCLCCPLIVIYSFHYMLYTKAHTYFSRKICLSVVVKNQRSIESKAVSDYWQNSLTCLSSFFFIRMLVLLEQNGLLNFDH